MKFTAIAVMVVAMAASCARAAGQNLIPQGAMEQHDGNTPTGFELSGAADYRYLGDPRRDMSSYGVALNSSRSSGEVRCVVNSIDATAGRWFRFTFRGLPQANFAVSDGDLHLKVAFFGQNGKISYDAKEKRLYDQVQQDRQKLSVNGDRKAHGAEVWRTYQLDFYLPFPQVDQLRLSVGFTHGSATQARDAAFYVDDFSLVRIPVPAVDGSTEVQPSAVNPQGKLIPIGGRWFYDAKPGETAASTKFNTANVDRLLYHDNVYSAPFAGNTYAWLRPGNKDLQGNLVKTATMIDDNVTLSFSNGVMTVHTHGVPNHPTGRYPELGFGNPSYIQELNNTYYFPLEPRHNPNAFATDKTNSNHALPMGPIGLATNGVVFFNPFDMGNQDATDIMDRCCGHPNQDNQYHYHKYPICVNTPWADEGKAHSPLIGWAFDGVPIYGPYESAGVMAKDVKGEHALNALNAHYDPERGWHYHVTPGQFPYLIGGFWGYEAASDRQRPNHPRGSANDRGGPDSGANGPSGNNRNGPPNRNGRGRPPMGPPPGP
jgi:hypothetical protein